MKISVPALLSTVTETLCSLLAETLCSLLEIGKEDFERENNKLISFGYI